MFSGFWKQAKKTILAPENAVLILFHLLKSTVSSITGQNKQRRQLHNRSRVKTLNALLLSFIFSDDARASETKCNIGMKLARVGRVVSRRMSVRANEFLIKLHSAELPATTNNHHALSRNASLLK